VIIDAASRGDVFRYDMVLLSIPNTAGTSVASVSVWFGSKERPKNRTFGVLPERKWGESQKTKEAGKVDKIIYEHLRRHTRRDL